MRNADNMGFTFSDLVAGYVTEYEWEKKNQFKMKTSDGRQFEVTIGDNCYAELMRNLGEPFVDCTSSIQNMLAPDRYLFAYGVFYPEKDDVKFEVKHIVFSGRAEKDYVFEKADWWIQQVRQLGDFYLKAQFGDGEIDYGNYRTHIGADGENEGGSRQECDTISRLVYGFASAYLLTGEDRYLEAAQKGTDYLRDHFRCTDNGNDTSYWYHAIDVKGTHERKILASEFGDDFNAIPAYEQIYALAGPTQTYRITGDKRIERDIQTTINLFQKYFLDRSKGGYFSHIDPITFDPRSEALDRNRSRKNWNSVGDHAPAYLINAVLATDNPEWRSMLVSCADTITEHFPDYENSAFVNEKFHEDWSHDQTWGWQQNRAVVGHNLKIAWNLTRIEAISDKKEYRDFAKKIADLMPKHGMDVQRGGWYDVVNRTTAPGQKWHRYAWHDRKAWWQQEQAILAYQILAGVYGDPSHVKLARESAAFYNAFFLDHDSGGVYFNVLANGTPYLMGQEREKGSHSMSGYHSFELCYLASVYTNLLITKQPLDLYFKPGPQSFKDNLLRVAPDMLPAGSIRLEQVWVEGKEYKEFDALKMTVKLPASDKPLSVKVRIVPTTGLKHFTITREMSGKVAKVTVTGELDQRAIPHFRKELEGITGASRLVVMMDKLDYLSAEGARSLVFAKQKMAVDADVYVVGVKGQVKEVLEGAGYTREVKVAASYNDACK